MAKKKPAPPMDHRVEIFSYSEIQQQTGIPHHLLRKVARRMGIEQEVFMRSSYGRVSPAAKKVGVRQRNLGRLIKAAAAQFGENATRDFERDVNHVLSDSTYRGFNGRNAAPATAEEMAKIDELGRKLGL